MSMYTRGEPLHKRLVLDLSNVDYSISQYQTGFSFVFRLDYLLYFNTASTKN